MKPETSAVTLEVLVSNSEIEKTLKFGAKSEMERSVLEIYLDGPMALYQKWKNGSPIRKSKIWRGFEATIDCNAIGDETGFGMIHHEPSHQVARRF